MRNLVASTVNNISVQCLPHELKINMRAVSKRARRASNRVWPAALLAAVFGLATAPTAQAQSLDSFAVLGGSTVTNTGPTVITGNVGVSPGAAITGFPPGIVNAPYTVYRANAVALQAQSDLTTAYNVLASRPTTADLTGVDLGGQTLNPGVYNFNTGAQLTGTVTLDAAGNPNAVFIFNIGSTLTTASASSVQLINGAQAGNVFFRVGSSATLGATTAFKGQILALTSITLITGATVDCGSVLARNGAVTLDTNVIGICPLVTAPIEAVVGGVVAVPGVAVPGAPVVPGAPGVGSRPVSARALTVARAIDAARIANGGLPLAFGVLALLTPDELDLALRQLSGEIGTSVAPAGFQSTNSFLDSVLGQRPSFSQAPLPPGSPGRRDIPAGQPGSPDASERGNVAALGYFPTIRQPSALDAFDNLSQPVAATVPNWTIWGGGYGGYSRTAGNDSNAERTIRDFGFAAGVDFQLMPDSTIGFAGGIGGTNFALSDGLSSGHSQDFQAAVFGTTAVDSLYVSGALAYGYHAMTTNRTVTIAGVDQFGAEFGSHSLAGEVEVGYNIGLLTPYAAVRAQSYMAPAYAETTQSGASTFALNYDAQNASTVRLEIGTHLGWSTDLGDDKQLSLHSTIAWAHDYQSGTAQTASFQALPGSSFTLGGAEASADSLLLSVGADLAFDNGFSLAATLDSAFSSNSQNYAGKIKLGYSF